MATPVIAIILSLIYYEYLSGLECKLFFIARADSYLRVDKRVLTCHLSCTHHVRII